MGMTYRLTAYGKSRRGLPGVPWRDLTAAEYKAACAANPGMDERGYFEPITEEDTSSPPSSARRQAKDEPVTAEENSDDR